MLFSSDLTHAQWELLESLLPPEALLALNSKKEQREVASDILSRMCRRCCLSCLIVSQLEKLVW